MALSLLMTVTIPIPLLARGRVTRTVTVSSPLRTGDDSDAGMPALDQDCDGVPTSQDCNDSNELQPNQDQDCDSSQQAQTAMTPDAHNKPGPGL